MLKRQQQTVVSPCPVHALSFYLIFFFIRYKLGNTIIRRKILGKEKDERKSREIKKKIIERESE